MYPEGEQTRVEVGELTRPLCGATRPGHFLGVTTVVTKLLVAARPRIAVFGEKDFQQLATIRRLARDLRFDTEIVGVPIVREPDGLALSSRNVLLAPEHRSEALALVRAELDKAPHGRVDYAELRDPESLELAPPLLAGRTLLALAVRFPTRADHEGSVRLIDNRVLDPRTEEKP
jgi:pantoate--beta-alanine ligase